MPPPNLHRDGRHVTLPQFLALVAIWTGVLYGLTTAKPRPDVEQIALKGKPAAACAGE